MTTTFNYGFTEEQLALKESALEFTKREVTPYLDQWEKDGEIPREFQKKLAHAGFLGVGVPEEVGGDGGTLIDACAMQQGFMEGGWSGGLMASAFTHGIAIPHIIQNGSQELIDTYARPVLAGDMIGSLAVTEPGAGSDVANIATKAVRDGDHYVINGAKTFITSSVRGDFVTTAVRTGEAGRARHLDDRRTQGHARVHRLPQARQDGLAGVRHRRAVLRGRAGPGRQPDRPGEPRLLLHRPELRLRADLAGADGLRPRAALPQPRRATTARSATRSASRWSPTRWSAPS